MSDLYIPSNPVVFPVRPLTTGMVTSIPPVAADEKSFQKINGFDVTERGLRKHGSWTPAYRAAGLSVPVPLWFTDDNAIAERRLSERVEDLFHLWLATGDTRICVVSNRLLYILDLSTGYKPVYWCRQYNVAGYNGAGTDAVLTLESTYVLTDLLAVGDWVELLDGATTKWFLVKAVDTALNTITLTGKPTAQPASFKVLKPFRALGENYVDFTIGRYKAYFADTYSPMVFQYDGTWMSPLVITNASGTRNLFGARTVSYYKERLYFGNITEAASAAHTSQRVRWTEVLDWTKSADSNYQDLSFRQGPVQKLLGFGDLLVAYMTDAVYYGRQTNLTNLPYAFYLLETAGTAPLGMKAVTSFIGGQLFVGPDDVYFLAEGPQISRVGSMVAGTALSGLQTPSATRLRVDLLNSRVVLAVGRSSESLNELYLWNFKSKGWSMATEPIFSTIAALSAVDQFFINEVPVDATFEGSPLGQLPMLSFMAGQGAMNLFGFDTSGHLLQYTPEGRTTILPLVGTEQSRPVYGQLETQDFEFGAPDDDKTVLELSLRLTDLVSGRLEDVRFRVEASTDSGRTWKPLGVLRIVAGDDEDSLNFRVTASVVRFRLTTGELGGTTGTYPSIFEVSGYTLRVRKRGPEAQRATTRP